MTSVRKMKLNLFFGVIIGVIGYCSITIISFLLKNPEEQKQEPIPQMLILPPLEIEEDLDIHPPLDLNPLDYSNVA
jgi:hypothetical protein